MKKVLVFGTFDIFHEGHKNFLKQARKFGDYLVVVIARDKTVSVIKKLKAKNNEQQRLKEVEKSGLVDEVMLGNLRDKYEVINKARPDVICLGYDQKFFIDKLEDKLKEFKLKTQVHILKPYKPEIFKSSKLRNNCHSRVLRSVARHKKKIVK